MTNNSILIVDDQKDVRNQIQDMLTEMNFGFEYIYQSGSAAAAIDIIDRHGPAIVLLDVVLPGSDGFTVAEYIRDRDIDTQIVIMTAFPQFDFALKAVQAKVAGFLVKPIDPAELHNVLLDIVKAGDTARKKLVNIGQHNYLYYIMLDQYMTSRRSDLDLRKISANTGLDMIDASMLMIAVFDAGETEKADERMESLSAALWAKGFKNIYYLHGQSTFVLIMGMDSRDELHSRLFRSRISHEFGSFTAGAAYGPREAGLRTIYNQAVFAFDYSAGLGVGNAVVVYNDLNIAKVLVQRHQGDILAALHQKDIKAFENALDVLFVEFMRNKVEADGAACELWEVFGRYSSGLLVSPTASSLNHLRSMIMSAVKSQMTDPSVSAVPDKVEQIFRFIENNYRKPLNLAYVANELNINYSYASSLFKKHAGVSFTDYLTRYRLARAVEMLENTNCYIYEVAEKVGFVGNKYFFRIFKKEYGLTPGEYHELKCRSGERGDD